MSGPQPLRAEDLRERVTILAAHEVANGRGGRTTDYLDGDEVWAEVIPLRGGEALVEGIQRGSQLYRVTIRIRADVTVKHRLRWRGQVLNIRTAAANVLRDGLVMTAEAGGGA